MFHTPPPPSQTTTSTYLRYLNCNSFVLEGIEIVFSSGCDKRPLCRFSLKIIITVNWYKNSNLTNTHFCLCGGFIPCNVVLFTVVVLLKLLSFYCEKLILLCATIKSPLFLVFSFLPS